jgi:hypothetical protein
MRPFRILLFAGLLAAVLTLDTVTQSHIVVHPGGSEAALVYPAAFWLLGTITTLAATVLAVTDAIRQKRKLRSTWTLWACGALLTGYVGLIFVHP